MNYAVMSPRSSYWSLGALVKVPVTACVLVMSHQGDQRMFVM